MTEIALTWLAMEETHVDVNMLMALITSDSCCSWVGIAVYPLHRVTVIAIGSWSHSDVRLTMHHRLTVHHWLSVHHWLPVHHGLTVHHWLTVHHGLTVHHWLSVHTWVHAWLYKIDINVHTWLTITWLSVYHHSWLTVHHWLSVHSRVAISWLSMESRLTVHTWMSAFFNYSCNCCSSFLNYTSMVHIWMSSPHY